jgi:hypothetical protein
MPRKKKSAAEVDEPVEEQAEPYTHGSLAKGDVPPDWVARAIADTLRGNPYASVPTDELRVLAKELYRAREQLALVENVLCARNSVW